MKFLVEWGHKNPEQTEAVWYYGYEACVATATLETDSGETYSLDIYCDGVTLYRVPTEDGETLTVRYTDEWEALGVRTDADLQAVSDKWMQRGVDICVNNSWFDLYTQIGDVSEHLDAVTHTTDDAEAQAEAILTEVADAGGWDAWFLKS